eukprot:2894125-Prymnesium_polylepis.1
MRHVLDREHLTHDRSRTRGAQARCAATKGKWRPNTRVCPVRRTHTFTVKRPTQGVLRSPSVPRAAAERFGTSVLSHSIDMDHANTN